MVNFIRPYKKFRRVQILRNVKSVECLKTLKASNNLKLFEACTECWQIFQASSCLVLLGALGINIFRRHGLLPFLKLCDLVARSNITAVTPCL